MIFTLNAEPRHTVRKSDLTNLRASGLIPAVIYGSDTESISISVKKPEFTQMHKKSFKEVCFWEIELAGKKYHTILKEKQIHPVGRHFLHLDFLVVSATSVIELDIPITFVGEAIGTKEGGMLDIQMHTIKVSCKGTDIPKELSLDVSDMRIGDSRHVCDLPSGSWTYLDHEDVTIAVVHAKKVEVVTEETPAAEPVEETEDN
ncbi:MAG: 50S ribosomal protein L25 [Candidatus Cloacimonetes bacterium HGW-Cloacimonetes-3]|jgi:large subunit ribosomal protein L25|nr:MAG: 50S ribosomal protein L25 [Candidatus Cloacimonetes bacterium HGW-Cloacimonetes-3]